MKPSARRQVDVEVGVMHHMEPPQERDEMEHYMLHIYDEIERDHSRNHLEPIRRLYHIEKPPAALLGEECEPYRACGEEQPDRDGVQEHDADVGHPPRLLGHSQRSARHEKLGEGHNPENAEEEAQPDVRFVIEDNFVHLALSPARLPPRSENQILSATIVAGTSPSPPVFPREHNYA
jgi:hypothetical protein